MNQPISKTVVFTFSNYLFLSDFIDFAWGEWLKKEIKITCFTLTQENLAEQVDMELTITSFSFSVN